MKGEGWRLGAWRCRLELLIAGSTDGVGAARQCIGGRVDAIVATGDGGWAAFEVKLGEGQIDTAGTTLFTFPERVDTDRCGAPEALGVIVGSGYRIKALTACS